MKNRDKNSRQNFSASADRTRYVSRGLEELRVQAAMRANPTTRAPLFSPTCITTAPSR